MSRPYLAAAARILIIVFYAGCSVINASYRGVSHLMAVSGPQLYKVNIKEQQISSSNGGGIDRERLM